MIRHEAPFAVLLKDYQAPHFHAHKIRLTIELDPDATLVTSRTNYTQNPGSPRTLRLQGKDLELLRVAIDGTERLLSGLEWSNEHLFLEELPPSFELEVTSRIRPRLNTALEGLYVSHGKFYTQCEPEGFRRLTYYLDRPDVMAIYETTIVADKQLFPVLLSNGNLVDRGDAPGGKHFAVWEDPFPKPSYLFALVAGDLSCVTDHFTTRSGRLVALHIYVEKENIAKCSFAMEAIKRAMRWDEEIYQLEYDLDLFMIVAVSDFNMGAMENKGLNIFNSKYVLASAETATDQDFENILGVVGHEYFHNWTGNRVTLRDWFQLSLKEGLTVFRDQQFSSDQGSAAVKRIQDVRTLREQQFSEDSGPMSHPVRPESYIEINNFYTATVYNKGAEIVRMLHSILGAEAFHSGMQLYFQTFDGQAVTIEDFLRVMAQSSGQNLDAFKNWYLQAGTPVLSVRSSYDGQRQQLKLSIKQKLGKSGKSLSIPVRTALLSRQGAALRSRYDSAGSHHEHLLLLTKPEQVFIFDEVTEAAIPSVLRNFSAPVILDSSYSRAELYTLLAHETDAFNKFEAAQTLAMQIMSELRQPATADRPLDAEYIGAYQQLLLDSQADPRLIALALLPPSVDYLMQKEPGAKLEAIYDARRRLMQALAQHCGEALLSTYHRCHDAGSLVIDRQAIGRRELKNACLTLLASLEQPSILALAQQQYASARHMSDAVAALNVLASSQSPAREECLQHFYTKWKQDPLVIDKWFAIQASSAHPEVLAHVKSLLKHPDFDILNPNRVYAVFRQFARCLPHGFHHLSGEGYAVVTDYALRIDRKNPQVAAMLTGLLTRFNSFDTQRQILMRKQLEKMKAQKDLSRDVFEVVSKSLEA